jgi:hypothetical protein
MGFEPTASSMRPKRSSQLSYTPGGNGQHSGRTEGRTPGGDQRCGRAVDGPYWADAARWGTR